MGTLAGGLACTCLAVLALYHKHDPAPGSLARFVGPAPTAATRGGYTQSAPLVSRQGAGVRMAGGLSTLPESSVEKIREILEAESYPKEDPDFDAMVKKTFPGAMSNKELETKVVQILADRGFQGNNTLLATSLCCDELARTLEDDLGKVYGKNFFLGGLAGFPFAGNTGFGAMAGHIPDNGNLLIVQGPHVGVTRGGEVGVVERQGIELVDKCCGSAIAASNYVQGITDGGTAITSKIKSFSDFQQNAVQQFILPHGKRLADAGPDRMKELPYALYESQDMLLQDIIAAGKGGLKRGTAVLGGVQINTGPDTMDYFHPLRFEYLDEGGAVAADLLPALTKRPSFFRRIWRKISR